MQPPAGKILFAIIALWLLLYGSFSLFRPPLLDDADSVHSEVAREMLVRHDWITLHANGIRYLEKAPLMYWSMAGSFGAFGPRDWAARLPLALYALALILVTYAFGRRLFDSQPFVSGMAGFYSALVLLTSFGIFLYTRIMIPDVMVCLWLTLAMLLFWRSLGELQPSRATAWGFAAVCALNVLTKGLIGIVFPLGIVVIFLLLTRNLRHLWRWHPLSSLLVFLAVALPWHIAAGLRNPAQGHPVGLLPSPGNVHGFFWFYFVNEQYLRYLNRRVPRDYDTVPLAIFWGLLVVWLMPWVAFLIAFLLKALRAVPLRSALEHFSYYRVLSKSGFVRLFLAKSRVGSQAPVYTYRKNAPGRRALARRDQALLLLAIWAAFVMLFFSFSTRQEYYALPVLPPLALMIGAWLAAEEQSERNGSLAIAGRRIAAALFCCGAIAAVAALLLAWSGKPPAPGADLAAVLSQNPKDYALSLGHFLDLSMRAMGFFRLPLVLDAVALFAGTLANLILRRRANPRLGNYCLAAMMTVFLIAAHLALVTFSPVLSSKALADAIQSQLRPGDIVEINGEYEAGSTLGFYLRRQVRILNGRSSNLWYGSFFEDAPHIFDDNVSFRQLWRGPQRIFLWTEVDNVPALPGNVYVLARSGGKEILTNRN